MGFILDRSYKVVLLFVIFLSVKVVRIRIFFLGDNGLLLGMGGRLHSSPVSGIACLGSYIFFCFIQNNSKPARIRAC